MVDVTWLVVDLPSENDGVKVSWDDDIPNIWKNKKCSKPPTSNYSIHMYSWGLQTNL